MIELLTAVTVGIALVCAVIWLAGRYGDND